MENSISKNITLRRFEGKSSLHYRSIKTTEYGNQLQEDVKSLTKWADTWQMTFFPGKIIYTADQERKQKIMKYWVMR